MQQAIVPSHEATCSLPRECCVPLDASRPRAVSEGHGLEHSLEVSRNFLQLLKSAESRLYIDSGCMQVLPQISMRPLKHPLDRKRYCLPLYIWRDLTSKYCNTEVVEHVRCSKKQSGPEQTA